MREEPFQFGHQNKKTKQKKKTEPTREKFNTTKNQ